MIINIHCICGRERASREELFCHLRAVLRDMDVKLTDSDSTLPGDDVQDARNAAIIDAQIVIVLHTAEVDLLPEVSTAVKRSREGLLRLVPVRLRKAGEGALSRLQLLPRDGGAVLPRKDRDGAWVQISEEVRKLCAQIRAGQPLRPAIRAALDRAAKCQGQVVAAHEGLRRDDSEALRRDNDGLRRDDHNERSALVHVLLTANLPELYPLWSQPLPDIKPDPNPRSLSGIVTRAILQVGHLRRDMIQEPRPEAALSGALEGLCDLAEDAAQLEEPDEGLFGDFTIGLAIFHALAAVSVLVAAPLLRVGKGALAERLRHALLGQGVAISFPQALGASFDAHTAFLGAAEPFYRKDVPGLWAEIVRVCQQFDGTLKEAVQRCVSLRATPRHPGLMALEQSLHWYGWGGHGEIFKLLSPYTSRNPLLGEIYNRLSYGWNSYGRSGREGAGAPPPFGWRISAFQQPTASITDYAADCTAALARHPALYGPGRQGYSFRIWGDAVGPLRATEKNILHALEDLEPTSSSADFRAMAVYTEASFECLRSLARQHYAVNGDRYMLLRDLNLPFPGEPGQPCDSHGEPWWPDANAFDVYVCSMALHQVVDNERGHDRLKAVLAFATRIVRPGGVLCLPDVSDGAWLQTCLLPINLVAREGHWSVDRAFGPGGWLSFLDVACRLDGTFLSCAELAQSRGDEMVKIPLPLLDLRRATPDSADELGLPVYDFTPCVVMPMRLESARELEHRWRRSADRTERASLGREHLQVWRPATSSLIADVRDILSGKTG